MTTRLKQERQETDALIREARELGFAIPLESGWWWDDVDNFGGSLQDWEFVRDDYTYLTELGKAGALKLIREERRRLQEQERQDIAWERQQTQWTLTKWGVIIGWVLGLAGILIAL